MVSQHPLDGPSSGFCVMAVGLVYPLLPASRTYFDGLTLGPLYQRDLRLNQAHVAITENDDSSVLASTTLPERAGHLLPALGFRRSGELLAAAWEIEHPEAAGLVDDFVALLGERSRNTFQWASSSSRYSACSRSWCCTKGPLVSR
jgi:hypothetical protein